MTAKIGTLAQQFIRQVASNNASTPQVQPLQASLPSIPPEEFAKSIVALVALKRTVDLTQAQVEAWYAVLGSFPVEVLNAAIVEMCLTETRFPEVGDLYAICRKSLPAKYAAHGDGKEGERPSKREIAQVAERLGLRVRAQTNS